MYFDHTIYGKSILLTPVNNILKNIEKGKGIKLENVENIKYLRMK